MVIINIKIVTSGNHAYVAENGITSYTTCLHSENQSGMDVKEDRGSSNHGTAHTYNYTKDVTVGDTLTVSLWEYVFANNKSIKLYVNGNLIDQSSGTSQCVTASTTLTASMLRSVSKPSSPTYLETLDKLDQWSSAQYIPNSRDRLNL